MSSEEAEAADLFASPDHVQSIHSILNLGPPQADQEPAHGPEHHELPAQVPDQQGPAQVPDQQGPAQGLDDEAAYLFASPDHVQSIDAILNLGQPYAQQEPADAPEHHELPAQGPGQQGPAQQEDEVEHYELPEQGPGQHEPAQQEDEVEHYELPAQGPGQQGPAQQEDEVVQPDLQLPLGLINLTDHSPSLELLHMWWPLVDAPQLPINMQELKPIYLHNKCLYPSHAGAGLSLAASVIRNVLPRFFTQPAPSLFSRSAD